MPKRPQDEISREQKVAVVEMCFLGYFWWFGNICEYIGRRIRLGESRGSHKVGGVGVKTGGSWAGGSE